jgi:hypothetical protein
MTSDGELHLLQLDVVVARDTTGSPDVGSSSSLCCCCACVRETEGGKEQVGVQGCRGTCGCMPCSDLLCSVKRKEN